MWGQGIVLAAVGLQTLGLSYAVLAVVLLAVVLLDELVFGVGVAHEGVYAKRRKLNEMTQLCNTMFFRRAMLGCRLVSTILCPRRKVSYLLSPSLIGSYGYKYR